MRTYHTAIEEIQLAVARNETASVREIDRLVAEVLASRETACIAPLLCCLDDRFEAQEAMFAIIHAAESFADEHYIPAYLAARPALSRSAPDWAAVLLKRIQNNAHSRAKLESLLSRGSA